MAHTPQGKGIAAIINKNAVPAIVYSKQDDTGQTVNWRVEHDVTTENIDVYLILKDAELTLTEDGEEEKQWAVLYTTQRRLIRGELVEFPDKNWKFLVRESTQRPAINPNYYKARGVKRD